MMRMRSALSLLLLLHLSTTTLASQEICTDGWKHFRGSCYQIFAKDFVLPGVNYARAMCRFHSADLVTIRSQAEQDFVHKLFEPVRSIAKYKEAYFGLNDAQKEMEFRWFDGSLATYTNWKDTEPNNWKDGEGCGGIRKDGLWNDVTCTQPPRDVKAYICEKNVEAGDRRSSLIFKKKGDGRWTNHVIGKELKEIPLVDCAGRCQVDHLCASYNYQRHLYLCQLNNGTRLEDMKYWEPDTSWEYYEIDSQEKP